MTGMANLTSVIDDIGHEPLPLSMTWIVSNNIARDGERDRADDHEAWMNGASGHPEDHISHVRHPLLVSPISLLIRH